METNLFFDDSTLYPFVDNYGELDADQLPTPDATVEGKPASLTKSDISSSLTKSDISSAPGSRIKIEPELDVPHIQQQLQLLTANAAAYSLKVSNPCDMAVDGSELAERTIFGMRLPMWGTIPDCLKMYRNILLSGKYQGQKVPVLDYVHRDLSLADGEVYLCTVPWLLKKKEKDSICHVKPRTPHHTFKFQRGPTRVGDVWHRKARCSRRNCKCTEDAAFEVVGVKLATDELTVYHFQKTAINKNNIHPRKGFSAADSMPGTPSALLSALEMPCCDSRNRQAQRSPRSPSLSDNISRNSSPPNTPSTSEACQLGDSNPSIIIDTTSTPAPLPFPNMTPSHLQSLIQVNIEFLKSQMPFHNAANNVSSAIHHPPQPAPKTSHCIDDRGSFEGGYRVAVFGENLMNCKITFSINGVWSEAAKVVDPNAKLAGGVITVIVPSCPFLDVNTMRPVTCDVIASPMNQPPVSGQTATFTYDAWRSITNCLMTQLQSASGFSSGPSGRGGPSGGGPSSGDGSPDSNSRPSGSSSSGGGNSGGINGFSAASGVSGGNVFSTGGNGVNSSSSSSSGNGAGDDDDDDYEDVDEFGDPVYDEGNQVQQSIRSLVDRKVLDLLHRLVHRNHVAPGKVLSSRGATGHTFLHIICLFGLQESALFALAHGADPAVTDHLQVLPIHVAARWWHDCPQDVFFRLLGSSSSVPSAPPRTHSTSHSYSSLASYAYACGNKSFGEMLDKRFPSVRRSSTTSLPSAVAPSGPPPAVMKRLADCLRSTSAIPVPAAKTQRVSPTSSSASQSPLSSAHQQQQRSSRSTSHGAVDPKHLSPRAGGGVMERAIVVQREVDVGGRESYGKLVPLLHDSSPIAVNAMPLDDVMMYANPFVIGRDPTKAHLQFAPALTAISACHAEISRDVKTGRHFLRDNSQNGTWHMSKDAPDYASGSSLNATGVTGAISSPSSPSAHTHRLRKGDKIEIFDGDELWLPMPTGFAHFRFGLSHTIT